MARQQPTLSKQKGCHTLQNLHHFNHHRPLVGAGGSWGGIGPLDGPTVPDSQFYNIDHSWTNCVCMSKPTIPLFKTACKWKGCWPNRENVVAPGSPIYQLQVRSPIFYGRGPKSGLRLWPRFYIPPSMQNTILWTPHNMVCDFVTLHAYYALPLMIDWFCAYI